MARTEIRMENFRQESRSCLSVLICSPVSFSGVANDADELREIPGGCLLRSFIEICQRRLVSVSFWNGNGCAPAVAPDIVVSEMNCGGGKIHTAYPDARKVFFCLESPMQAKRLHLNLGRITEKFDSAYVYKGLVPLSRAALTTPITFPIDRDRFGTSSGLSWSERSGIGFVGSPKSVYHVLRGGSDRTIRGAIKDLLFLATKGFHRAFSGVELYGRRLDLATSLPALTVYGRGWNTFHLHRSSNLGGAPVGVTGKLAALEKHRFALCLENYSFPGYITEKLSDAIAAGTVPIYQGDPEIRGYISDDAFIDASAFRDARDLAVFLDGISEERWGEYVSAGQRWVNGLSGRGFLSEEIASRMLARFET